MFIYRTDRFTFCAGTRTTLYIPTLAGTTTQEQHRVQLLCDQGSIPRLALLDQIHSNRVHQILSLDDQVLMSPRQMSGDSLISALPHVGLGLDTADCLPLMLYDPIKHVAAAIHAGWRGLVSHIIEATIAQLSAHYASNPEQLLALIGPSAKGCCYEVSPDWPAQLTRASDHTALHQRDGKLFFDLASAASARLAEQGVPASQQLTPAPFCTICSPHFWSHRRDQQQAQRNVSFIMLHSR